MHKIFVHLLLYIAFVQSKQKFHVALSFEAQTLAKGLRSFLMHRRISTRGFIHPSVRSSVHRSIRNGFSQTRARRILWRVFGLVLYRILVIIMILLYLSNFLFYDSSFLCFLVRKKALLCHLYKKMELHNHIRFHWLELMPSSCRVFQFYVKFCNKQSMSSNCYDGLFSLFNFFFIG